MPHLGETNCFLQFFINESVLMHYPVSPLTIWGSPTMKNQGLLHSHGPWFVLHRSVISCCLPVPLVSSPIHSGPISIFLVQCTEKIVLLVPALQTRLSYSPIQNIKKKIKTQKNITKMFVYPQNRQRKNMTTIYNPIWE